LAYDLTLKAAFENITNSNLGDKAWSQATLPVYVGGMRLRIVYFFSWMKSRA